MRYTITSTRSSLLLLITVPVVFFIALAIAFMMTRTGTPFASEIFFTEHSTVKENAGSVIPASCDSNGDGNYDTNGPCYSPNAYLQVY